MNAVLKSFLAALIILFLSSQAIGRGEGEFAAASGVRRPRAGKRISRRARGPAARQ